MSTAIALRGLTKRFGQTVAVDHVDLDIPAGSLFFLLGPSGCGKTTLLRMIAGLTSPSEGRVLFGNQDMTHEPANRRNCGMVFQSYALWPHMTVWQNVAFGLEVRKVPMAQRAERVGRALEMVQMTQYHARKPNALSGGQQQRVALARALVVEPMVLLFDEPLSNLDAKLRLDMRSQIRDICRHLRTTAVYVTHDQKEALSMADGVAVLDNGRVVQTGAPRELYDRPANRFVADFLGETNFLSAEIVTRSEKQVELQCPAGVLRSESFPEDLPQTGNVTCSIRPEAVRLSPPVALSDAPDVPNALAAKRTASTYLGEMAQHQFELRDGTKMKVFELNPAPDRDGDTHPKSTLDIHPRDVVILHD